MSTLNDSVGSGPPEMGGFDYEPRASRTPSGFLWLWYLFLRPRTFFPHFAVDHAPLLTSLAAWISGVAGVTAELDSRAMSNPERFDFIQTWLHYWGFSLAFGALSGLMYFALGGWWFYTRLGLCGLKQIDKSLARRVYLYGSLTHAFPALIIALQSSLRHATPQAYWSSEFVWWDLLGLLFWGWSIGTVYAGARVVFGVRGFRGFLWFALAPLVLMGGFCVGVAGLSIAGALAPPDTTHTRVFDAPLIRLEYPGNWDLVPDDDPDDLVEEVWIESMSGSLCGVQVLRAGDVSPDEVEEWRAGYDGQFAGFKSVGEFDELGRYKGVGRMYQMTYGALEYELRLFIGSVADDVQVRVFEMVEIDSREQERPGFGVIRQSLSIDAAGMAAP